MDEGWFVREVRFVEVGRVKYPPKPVNLAAMEAAFRADDEEAIRRERAAYDQQLEESGWPKVQMGCGPDRSHSYHRSRCLFCGRWES